MRCYINIPAVRQARGDAVEPLTEMVEEGLQLARRSAANHTIAWLAGNQAEFLADLGRFEVALECLDEAITQGAFVGNSLLTGMRSNRSRVRRLLGDTAGADRALEEAAAVGGRPEAQEAVYYPLNLAYKRWPDDPRGALESLAAWTDEDPAAATMHIYTALEIARMAYRLGDDRMLARAAELRTAVGDPGTSPLHQAKARWLDELTGSGDPLRVLKAADTLEALGYRVPAADARADAALMAARAGIESDAGERVLRFCAEVGMHPLLGPLPETRWLEPAASRPVAADS